MEVVVWIDVTIEDGSEFVDSCVSSSISIAETVVDMGVKYMWVDVTWSDGDPASVNTGDGAGDSVLVRTSSGESKFSDESSFD